MFIAFTLEGFLKEQNITRLQGQAVSSWQTPEMKSRFYMSVRFLLIDP